MINGYLYFINCRDYIRISLLCLMFKNNLLDLWILLVRGLKKDLDGMGRLEKKRVGVSYKGNHQNGKRFYHSHKNFTKLTKDEKENFYEATRIKDAEKMHEHPTISAITKKEVLVANITHSEEYKGSTIPVGKDAKGEISYLVISAMGRIKINKNNINNLKLYKEYFDKSVNYLINKNTTKNMIKEINKYQIEKGLGAIEDKEQSKIEFSKELGEIIKDLEISKNIENQIHNEINKQINEIH